MSERKPINWKKWILILCAWESLALYNSFQNYIFSINAGTQFDWYTSLTYRGTNNFYWALLMPLIFFLAKKFNIDSEKPVKNISILILFGIPVAIFQSFFSIFTNLSVKWLSGAMLIPFWERIQLSKFGILGLSFESFFYYCIVLAILFGIQYYQKNKEHEYNLSQLEVKLSQAELQNMKMQLHPHFLFNTLHAISTLMHRDTNAADKMITDLSMLLRKSLDNIGVHEVTLEEEIEFLSKYIEIQKMRFNDNLQISMNIDSSTLKILVPNLILQPIVENAFKHGVEQISSTGEIIISSFLENNMLELSVQDNGPGRVSDMQNKNGHGVGLNNTYERLKQLYGGNEKIIIENAEPKGIKMRILIPVK